MKTSTAVLALFAATATAAWTPSHQHKDAKRADSCGQYDTINVGNFKLYNNMWGKDNGSGNQCVGLDSSTKDSSSGVAWHATWSWSGGQGQVKSYPNLEARPENKKVSDLTNIQSTWKWSYKGDNIVGDVAYDIFTSSSAGGKAEYEIMIWTAALGGAGPISSTGSPIDNPTVGGKTWKLYKGTNAATTVFSFVAPTEIQDFSGNLAEFFTYLTEKQSFPASQYYLSIGAGTEPFTGQNAVFTTSSYTVTF
ncbi:concanavalin A-like lectin/glucanase domain-containing protein [Aspergillus pseudotamarii]|uniref:xyloglucan-specific endo-beta-1,4-glucanase n=1 Tax=Aspergillus pseudotamarii TaxID=132259 RepID=A0A5N6TBG3_ASPPS|nr:concanavalin A-like lectin/glucanase domain-containing protein [Aspergillus pseudotamarii]KAE8143636.1 concanavalin A-like lectin/glucanase domain-containing protein [Aspergillus pseudotamarii]